MSGGNYRTIEGHCNYMYMYIRAGKRFKPSFVCCTFEAKFLPWKLRCHTHFSVCTCALLQSKRVVKNLGVF